ncbi:mitochondrial import inner membrane translocase [Chloropicon primus]|uniref:Mitochondrial import inner membrane translocase subunit n=1 Tax=Chloropicon primus TaxID=1764295 RepID=A0A5B8MCC4_9CHLO|nr:mitochondrial import inner membrane translocase [Chloropicon primus]|eukprot:QDZ17761.1 mitochondrial import inner membrane translocase [Chloropicon primus]
MSNQGVSPQMMSFLEQEKKKAAVNEIIGQLTNICWDKCMSTPGRKLSYGEEQCLSNCAQRFFESSQILLQKIGEKSGSGGM